MQKKVAAEHAPVRGRKAEENEGKPTKTKGSYFKCSVVFFGFACFSYVFPGFPVTWVAPVRASVQQKETQRAAAP